MKGLVNLRSSSESTSFKRLRPGDSDSETEPEHTSDIWPRYIVISAIKSEQTFDKLSPFVVSKALKGIIGEDNDAKILKSGKVLVQCKRQEQSVNLLKCKFFGNIPIEASPHNTLNFCKGVIRSHDFRNASEAEMYEDLKDQHVTEVSRVVVTRNGVKTPTNTFILKFDTPTLPSKVKAALTVCSVEPFVPNPLRCFNCQKFGHHKEKCGREIVCARCGQEGHEHSSCNNPLHCPNCSGDHFAYSKECAKWKLEKEIQAVKVKQNLSFQDARKLVQSRTPGGPSSPSYAAVIRTESVQAKSQECSSCKLLLEKLCTLFPEKANEIRQVQHDMQKTQKSVPSTSTSKDPKTPPSQSAKTVNDQPQNTHSTSSNVKKRSKSPKSQQKKEKSPQKPTKANPPQTKSNTEKDKQRPRLQRLNTESGTTGASSNGITVIHTKDGNMPEVALNAVHVAENQFAALEQMEDENEYDSEWKHPPSWSDDPNNWVNSKAGD